MLRPSWAPRVLDTDLFLIVNKGLCLNSINFNYVFAAAFVILYLPSLAKI